MQVEVTHSPGNSVAKVSLKSSESCVSEGGAMLAIKGDVSITTSTHKRQSGSLFAGLKRMLAGESFFVNHFKASRDGDEVWFAATLPGDILMLDISGLKVIASSGSFLFSESSVEMDLGWQGFKSLLSGESVFWLSLSGQGKVALSSFGSIYQVDVEDEYIVDTGHIVAFEETLSFSISKSNKSIFGSYFGGEGFVCRFKGRGKLWCQSHNPTTLGRRLGPLLKPR